MRAATYIAAFIGGLVVCYLLVSLGVFEKIDSIRRAQEEPSLNIPTYLSFISVMMTAVTAVLAAIAIFIGIVAAFTFKELSEKAASAAEKRVNEALSDDVIKSRIDEIAFRYLKPRSSSELEAGFDAADDGDR